MYADIISLQLIDFIVFIKLLNIPHKYKTYK